MSDLERNIKRELARIVAATPPPPPFPARRPRSSRTLLVAGLSAAAVLALVVGVLAVPPLRERVQSIGTHAPTIFDGLVVDAGVSTVHVYDLPSGRARTIVLPGESPGDRPYDLAFMDVTASLVYGTRDGVYAYSLVDGAHTRLGAA